MTVCHVRACRCCPASGECQRGLRRRLLRIRRRSKGLIEPSHQVAVSKEVHTQQRHQVRQAPAEARGQLQVAQQQHRDQCCPDLGPYSVGRSTHEGLHLQILLERLERLGDILPTNSIPPK